MKEKIENYAAPCSALIPGSVAATLRWRRAQCRQSKSFTADEALAQHLVDYIATDENDLFRQLEGKTITRFDGSKTVLHLAGQASPPAMR